jgi:CHC2 zinc finger/RepB DNA-primase from phage plasmid
VSRVNRALDSYLRMLAGPLHGRAGRWLDVRWPEPSSPSEMGREFLSAERLTDAGVLIEALARRIDVYIGIALHDRKAGDRTSVSRSHLAWTDIDREDAQALLDGFPHPPTMTVSSGSPGRRHAYWLLNAFADIDEVMTANRKLAGALGADLSSGLSRVSMLRPPGTYNYKHEPRQPVRIVGLSGSRAYDLAELVAGLTDPKPPRPPYVPTPGPVTGIRLEDPSIEHTHAALKNLDAREWMPRLTGVELSASGYMPCPFHDERTASLKAYPNGSWYCYGCHQGGSVFDFAARLWGRDTRGVAFVELRADLARLLLAVELPTPDTLRQTPVGV